jgi:glycosyltransferase involved in cell wall biosynthesis
MYIRYLSEELVRRGHTVTVLTSNAYNLQGLIDPIRGKFIKKMEEKINDVEVVRFKVNHSISFPTFVLKQFININAFLPKNIGELIDIFSTGSFIPDIYKYLIKNAHSYDLLHCTPFPLTITYLSAYYSLQLGLPLIVTPFFHFENPQYYNRYLINILKYANAIFVCTNLEKEKIAELGVKRDKIYIVPMGIDPKEWMNCNGKRFREKYNLGNKPIIFFTGTKTFDKGAIHLLRAIKIVQQKRKDVVLVAAGFGFAEWRKEVKKLKLANLLDFEYLSGQEKRDAFAACDVYCMPSRADAFGIAFLEAWICGKPVIGAKAGATPEVIRDGVDGLLVKFGDDEELAEKIMYLIDNPELRAELGARGRERVLSNYTWPIIASRVEKIYERIIS